MPFVLAIEPDPQQAALVRHVVCTEVHAELALVDSKEAALAELQRRVPDLILSTALLSPRDEADISSYLRTIDGASHLQTLTIPFLAAPQEAPGKRKRIGLLGKRKPEVRATGCDPQVFADEVRGYLDRAREVRDELAAREAAWQRREEMIAAAQRTLIGAPARPVCAEPPPVEPVVAEPAPDPVPVVFGENELIERLRAVMRTASPAPEEEAEEAEVNEQPAVLGFFGLAALPRHERGSIARAMLPPEPEIDVSAGFFGLSQLPEENRDAVGLALTTVPVSIDPPVPFYGISAMPAVALHALAAAQVRPVKEPACGFFGAAAASAIAIEAIAMALAPRPVEAPIGFFGLSASPAPVLDLIGRTLVTRRGPPVVGLALSHHDVARVAASLEGSAAAWRRPAFFGVAVASTEVLQAAGAPFIPRPEPVAFFGLSALAENMREAIGRALLPPPIPVPAPFFGLAALPGALLTRVGESLRPADDHPLEPEFVLTPPSDEEMVAASGNDAGLGTDVMAAAPPPGFVHALIHVDALELLPLEMLGTTNDLESLDSEEIAGAPSAPVRVTAEQVDPGEPRMTEPLVVMREAVMREAVMRDAVMRRDARQAASGPIETDLRQIAAATVTPAPLPDNLAWVGKAIEELILELRDLKHFAPAEPAAAPNMPAESAAAKTKAARQVATGSRTRATARARTARQEPAAPARSGRSKSAGKTVTSRATPLAMWARRSVARPAEERLATISDLRAMMAARAVPEQVLALTSARGCRIGRVRVAKLTGKRQKRRSNEPIIILSRKVLRELKLGSSLQPSDRPKTPVAAVNAA